MNRVSRLVVTASAGVLAATSLAACGSGGSGSDSDVITIGVVGPSSGAQAEIGQNQFRGAGIAVDQINADGGIDGKKLKLVTQDEGDSPSTAAAAIRSLTNDGVSLQMGMLSSADCLAVAPTLPRLQVTMVATGCTNDGLTGQDGKKAPNANFFRVGSPDSTIVESLAKVVADKFPDVTDYSAFGYDYVTGTSEWKIYQKTLQDQGVDLNVAKETFVALGEQNFKPYVQALADVPDDKETSALYLGTYGAGTASFLQQARDLALASKYKLIVQPGGYYPVARTLNGQAPNVWNSYTYNYAAFDNAMNDAFVKDFKAKYDKLPVSWSFDAYQAVQAYKAAIEKAGSADYADVLKALPGTSFDSPAGKLTIDATTHQSNTPVVVTDTVGDPAAPEDVKVLDTEIVKTGE